MNKDSIGLIIIGALLIVSGFFIGSLNQKGIGGSTSSDWNVGGALTVTGATTLNGAVTATTDLNLDDSNSTTTVAVGNTGTGKLCLWNGASYSILSFASNATTTSIATSTSCQ